MVTKKKDNTRTQLYWSTLLSIPVQAIVFVISILVTRMLDPDDFGIMVIVMMLIGYSNLLTNFGFNEAVIQKSVTSYKVINSIFTFNLVMSIILAGLFFVLSGYIAEFFNIPEVEEVVKIMSSVFIITSFYGLPVAMLRRDMNFKAVSIFVASKSLLMSLITLILAMNNYGYWALVYGQLIPLLVVTLMLCIKVKFLPRIYFNMHSMRGIFHFGGWTFLMRQLQFFGSHTDKFIVGRLFGVAPLGFYSKAVALSEAPYDMLTINVNGVMFSAFSAAKDDKDKLRQQFKKSLAVVAYLNFPMYLGFIVVAPYFVNVLLGDKWAPMVVPFQIILVSFLLSSFSGLLASMNVGIGKYKELTMRLLLSVVVFIIFCLFLLSYNIEGIAVAFLIYNLMFTILSMDLALRNLEVKWVDMFGSIKSGAIASAAMFVFVSLLAHYVFSEFSILNMACIVAAGVLSYLLYVLMDPADLITELKAQVWSDIKKALDIMIMSRK